MDRQTSEYELEIKPTKLIKGQGLSKLLVESNYMALDMKLIQLRHFHKCSSYVLKENMLKFED
jgi:hypothetical protein